MVPRLKHIYDLYSWSSPLTKGGKYPFSVMVLFLVFLAFAQVSMTDLVQNNFHSHLNVRD